jgi:methionine-rich copper-binding protein CopC
VSISAPLPRLTRLPALLLALLLAMAGLLMAAAPASAHDQLVSTDPVADSTLDALPAELTLTYSADILAEPGATLVQVTDATGADIADGDPVVSGATVTQALTPGATGAVSVVWKVVSSDGHPIDGAFGFTVAAAEPAPTDAASPTPSDTPEPMMTTMASPSPTLTSAAPADDDADAPNLWWLLVVIVVLVVVAVVWFVVARRRRSGGDATSGSAAGR